jgi:hypothetical protein
VALLFELIAKGSLTTVLPNDRVIDGLTGFPIPNNCGFPLIGNADCFNIGAIKVGFNSRFRSYPAWLDQISLGSCSTQPG